MVDQIRRDSKLQAIANYWGHGSWGSAWRWHHDCLQFSILNVSPQKFLVWKVRTIWRISRSEDDYQVHPKRWSECMHFRDSKQPANGHGWIVPEPMWLATLLTHKSTSTHHSMIHMFQRYSREFTSHHGPEWTSIQEREGSKRIGRWAKNHFLRFVSGWHLIKDTLVHSSIGICCLIDTVKRGAWKTF